MTTMACRVDAKWGHHFHDVPEFWSGEGADFRFAVPLSCAGGPHEGVGTATEIDDRRIGGDPGLVQQWLRFGCETDSLPVAERIPSKANRKRCEDTLAWRKSREVGCLGRTGLASRTALCASQINPAIIFGQFGSPRASSDCIDFMEDAILTSCQSRFPWY